MAEERFPFAFDRRFVPMLAAIGVRESNSWVVVDDERLRAHFGRWRLTTPVSNIKGVQVSRGYRWFKVVGPRMSMVDRGLTFGTNPRAGVCVSFHEPLPALFGRRGPRHPGLTMTVADPEGLAAAVARRLPAA